jgi:DNA-binding transcriptional LysR family regulator
MQAQGKPLTHQIDLNLLELFDTVFRTRNLTATGVRLGLSQPAVSYGLAKLRESYGDALFVRMQRGVQPTPFAEQLAQPVAAALHIVRGTVQKTAFVPAQATRTFRIAMTDIGERYFMPRLSQWLAAQAPGVTVETLSPTLAELSEGLATGDVDMAVGYIPGLGKQLHQQVLFREHFVYLMRQGHPALAGALTVGQLRHLGHVVASPPGTQHFATVEKVLASPRVKARIALRVRSFLCVGPIVAETDLVSPVPNNLARLVATHLDLRLCPPPTKFPEFDISMYWHQRYHQDPALLWMREAMASLFATGKKRG